MGFWGKLGKGLLKIAPYAAMAIPGVGVPLGMAIAGGTSAASKKLSGGSWKDALLSGGIDAGLSAVGGSGIGPSAGTVAKAAGKKTVKSVLGDVGKNVLTGVTGVSTSGGLKNTIKGVGKTVLGRIAQQSSGGSSQQPYQQPNDMPRGIGPSAPPMTAQPQMDYRTPNLAFAIQNGRNQAIQAQPWRKQPYDNTQPLNIYPNEPY